MHRRRISRFRRPLLVALGAIVLLVAGIAASASVATRAQGATQPSVMGVYRGPANPADVAAYSTWLGTNMTWALDFEGHATWSDIENPGWLLSGWKGSPYKLVLSVPMIPDSGGTNQEGATGAYNSHFVKLAQTLVAYGYGNATLRLGWEFNGDWFKWTAAGDPAAYAAYWRQIVTAMRSVPGAS